MNRRSFFKSLALAAAVIYAPRVLELPRLVHRPSQVVITYEREVVVQLNADYQVPHRTFGVTRSRLPIAVGSLVAVDANGYVSATAVDFEGDIGGGEFIGVAREVITRTLHDGGVVDEVRER